MPTAATHARARVAVPQIRSSSFAAHVKASATATRARSATRVIQGGAASSATPVQKVMSQITAAPPGTHSSNRFWVLCRMRRPNALINPTFETSRGPVKGPTDIAPSGRDLPTVLDAQVWSMTAATPPTHPPRWVSVHRRVQPRPTAHSKDAVQVGGPVRPGLRVDAVRPRDRRPLLHGTRQADAARPRCTSARASTCAALATSERARPRGFLPPQEVAAAEGAAAQPLEPKPAQPG